MQALKTSVASNRGVSVRSSVRTARKGVSSLIVRAKVRFVCRSAAASARRLHGGVNIRDAVRASGARGWAVSFARGWIIAAHVCGHVLPPRRCRAIVQRETSGKAFSVFIRGSDGAPPPIHP